METGHAEETPLETGHETTEAPKVETEVIDPIKELGYEDNEAGAKAIREARKKISQQGEENAALRKSLERPPERTQVTEDEHFENPVRSSKIIASHEARKEVNNFKWDLAAESEKTKNPEEFEKLIPYMQKVGQLEPHLNNDAKNMPMIVRKAREDRMSVV